MSEERIAKAADEYVAATGVPHSGGHLESAFEAGAKWAAKTERERCLSIVSEWYGGGRSFVLRKISDASLSTPHTPTGE